MPSEQKEIADAMLAFLSATPLTPDLEWTKDPVLLYHFESPRSIIVRDSLLQAGLKADEEFEVLDFGYLHGLSQEFFHRNFPRAKITVCDRPESPIFSDPAYQASIQAREYLTLVPQNIRDAGRLAKRFRVIVLGEIIEHLDPTLAADVLRQLRQLAAPDALLVVTTPNGSGLYNCWMMLQDRENVVYPPIPHPTHGYEHIHLWCPNVLARTAAHFGWAQKNITFYHGRDAEMFSRLGNSNVKFKSRLIMRSIKFLAGRIPRMRGYYVAIYGPK